MTRILTLDQKLRLAVEEYGRLLGLEKFYERVKKHEWRVKSCKDRSIRWKEAKLETYRAGISAIESGMVDVREELRRVYHLHCKVQKKKSKSRK